MQTLYAQLVHLFKVPTDGEAARKWSSEDLAGVVLSLCSPIVAQRGDGSGVLVRRLPVLADVLDAPQTLVKNWAHRPVLEGFLEATGLNAHRPLSPGSLRLHQFLCVVNPSLGNASPDTFHLLLDLFKWPTTEIFQLLLHILVHPLPRLNGAENWSDARLATALLAQMGPVVFSRAPLAKDLDALAAPRTPPMPDWARIPRTALAFHMARLRDTHFDSFLAWSAMQNLQLVPTMLIRATDGCVHKRSEKLLKGLVETFEWLFRSGRDADDMNELRFHRTAHCVCNQPHLNCPYHDAAMVGGQELHQWCHCSGARLIEHVDPLWTLAHATDAGSCLEKALCAVIEALGNAMPAKMTVQVPKHKINQVPALRPMMQKITASPLLHMGRYAPALVETVLNSNRHYFLEDPEGVAALAEFFAHLLRWTIPRSALLRHQHGGAAVPGKTIARFAAIRTGLVHTLLEAPWGLLPRNWDSPIAAQWYTSKHGTDPNLSNAPTSLWDVDLTDGVTATEVVHKKCNWWADEGAIALLRVAGTYIDLDDLSAEKLEVRVKDEDGTERVKPYEETAPAPPPPPLPPPPPAVFVPVWTPADAKGQASCDAMLVEVLKGASTMGTFEREALEELAAEKGAVDIRRRLIEAAGFERLRRAYTALHPHCQSPLRFPILAPVPRRGNSNGKWVGVNRYTIPHYLHGRKGVPHAVNGDPMPSEHTNADALDLRACIEDILGKPMSDNAAQAKTAADSLHAMVETIHWARLPKAYYHALSLPTSHATLQQWVQTVLFRNYRARTLRAVLCAALHPELTSRQCMARSNGLDDHHLEHSHSKYVIDGLKLHLRMHAFLKAEVETLYTRLQADLANGGLTAPSASLPHKDRGTLVFQLFLPSFTSLAPAAPAPASAPAAPAPTAAPAAAQHHDPLLELLKSHSTFTSEQCDQQAAVAKAVEASLAPPPPPTAEPEAKRQKQGDLKSDPICLD